MQPVFTIPPTSSGDSIAGRVVLGRYRIIRPLGRGGTGVVYLGRTEGAAGFSKPVVIKRMLPSLVKDPRHAQMLVREARILANLKHTGIVGVVDLGEEDDAYVMVLEYVHGYDLGHWLKYLRHCKRRLPVEVALEISIRVLEALHYAHTQKKPDGSPGGVIHRDISPSNILLDLDGAVRILDFGIAHVTDELGDADTKKNLFKGKIGYSHPSLLQLGTPSAATDTYSAAVVTLQMLIGTNPFYADSTAATIERVINHPLPRLRDFLPNASPKLEQILLKALSRDLTRGYTSALEFAEALNAERQSASPEAAALLLEMVQADFTGDMPSLLKLEALETRDAAWRSYVGHSDGLRRLSRSPDSGEPTVLERRSPRADSSDEPTTLAGQGSLQAPASEITAPRGVGRARNTTVYLWLVGTLSLALAGLAIVLVLRNNTPQTEPRYLVVSGEQGAVIATSGVVTTTTAVPATSPEVVPIATQAPTTTSSTPGKPEVTATSPKEPTSQYLTQVFSRRQSQIQACFAKAKPEQTSVVLQIAFQVDASGKVTSANVSPSALANTPLGTCLLNIARSTRFGALTQSASFRIPVRASVRAAGGD